MIVKSFVLYDSIKMHLMTIVHKQINESKYIEFILENIEKAIKKMKLEKDYKKQLQYRKES